jgi:hypothetical protein
MSGGMQNSYVNTVPQKRVVSDRILMADPMEQPLVSALGLDGESKFKFVNAPGKVYEWLEDAYSPLSDVIANGLASDSTTTTFSATDGTKYQPGDVLLIDSEYVWVSGVSGNVVTIVRNYGGTQATHANSTTAYIKSRARLEGASANDSHFTEIVSAYNYSFIMQKTIEISRSDARLQRYGIPNLVDYEINKKMDELKIELTRKPYYGIRAAGSASTPRDCGGFDTFISTNVTACSGAALTLKNIEDAVQAIWGYGGRPSLLVCDGWGKRKITSFFEGAVRTERSESMGGVEIAKVQTAMGPVLDVLVDRYIPAGTMYILTPDEVGFVTIDEFFYEDLAKTKDTAAYGQIVGEYGFALACEKHHAKISGYSTSL